jgi:retinol dehydrogenase 12
MTIPKVELAGRYCLITGATGGIGEATAKVLVQSGAKLTVICRSREKGNALKQRLDPCGDHPLDLLVADLSSQADIRRVADQYLESGKPLQLLINNAGVVNTSRHETVDGIENTFAVNHLAYFLLTRLLLERITQSAPARIVNVASAAYTFVKEVGLDDLNATRQYKTFKVYGRSKLANILFTRQLCKQLKDTGVTVNCVHPGAVSTGLGQQNNLVIGKLVSLILKPFFRTPEHGAQTSLHVALSPELEGVSGAYFSNCKQVKLKPWACDDDSAAKLWLACEKMTGLSAG